MKRLFSALLVLSLLLASLPALSESAGPEPLARGAVLTVDLDGDGTDETVSWDLAPGEYDLCLTLTVTGANGVSQAYPTDIIQVTAVYVCDLDGDAAQEILLTGDVMSDDYYTWCLCWADGALREVLFPDSNRGESAEGYFKYGYGEITAIDDNRITLTGSQDMLGTWFASRTLTLTPYYRFEFDDDGLWTRDLEGPEDADRWGYGALTVKTALPYTDDQGRTGTLEPGAQLMIYATDKREIARFVTRDGVYGTFSIGPDYGQGWGWCIGGIPEADCFELVPYAD